MPTASKAPDRPIHSRSGGRWLLLAVLALGLAACVQNPGTVRLDPSVQPVQGARVLIMPPDVEVSELTAGGLLEPNAAWTAAAEANIDQALKRMLADAGAEAVRFNDQGKLIRRREVSQLIKLHGAVGGSILLYEYNLVAPLLTKQDSFDWTLGKDAAILGKAYKSDYALFVFFRDSFSSDARIAINVVTAILGAGVRGGEQVGFASVVDLRSGDIVWFNVMARGSGDLRVPDQALDASRVLLSELPF